MEILTLYSLFASSFIASTLLPGGSEVMLALMAHEGVYGLGLLILTATLGNSLGGLVTWGMGAWVAYRFPERALQVRQQKAQGWLQRFGALTLLLSWLPLIGDPLCFVAGWLRLRLLPCLLCIVVGKLGRYVLVGGVFGGL